MWGTTFLNYFLKIIFVAVTWPRGQMGTGLLSGAEPGPEPREELEIMQQSQ